MTVFLRSEFIVGMMVGIEFKPRYIILDLLIVRFYLGWVDDKQVS